MTEQPAKPPEAPQDLSPGQFGQFLKDHGIATTRLPDSCGVETFEIASTNLEAAIKLLRGSAEVKLDYLVCLSGTDSQDSIDSIYHLWSYSNLNELVIKVKVDKKSIPHGHLPAVPSLSRFWKAADWHERETYDLVGIRYTGHPYMRRILNPWDWEGHPLRRDYKQLVDALNDKSPGSFR